MTGQEWFVVLLFLGAGYFNQFIRRKARRAWFFFGLAFLCMAATGTSYPDWYRWAATGIAAICFIRSALTKGIGNLNGLFHRPRRLCPPAACQPPPCARAPRLERVRLRARADAHRSHPGVRLRAPARAPPPRDQGQDLDGRARTAEPARAPRRPARGAEARRHRHRRGISQPQQAGRDARGTHHRRRQDRRVALIRVSEPDS